MKGASQIERELDWMTGERDALKFVFEHVKAERNAAQAKVARIPKSRLDLIDEAYSFKQQRDFLARRVKELEQKIHYGVCERCGKALGHTALRKA